uniref:hypothetical protein n=1 Tax=Endozoicomonas elysicola TaxID=305900 RepID=UPI0038B22E12
MSNVLDDNSASVGFSKSGGVTLSVSQREISSTDFCSFENSYSLSKSSISLR